ncbi:MAG: PQQ-binding-like beta-propeller repeat protein [Bryobacteraceae bacterium]
MRSATILIALASIALANDWPQWRGPGRDGLSRETGLISAWPKEGPKMLWRIEGLGDGYGAPAVAGGRLYVVGNKGMQDESVHAVSVEDGKTIWSTRLGNVGNPDQAPSYPSARSTPIVDGNLLYAFSSDGDLVCMESASGKVRWRKNVRKELGGEPGKWAYAESPLIDGNNVVVSPGGAQATMAAFNKKNGEVVWKSSIPGGEAAGYASIVPATAGGKKQYVQFLSKGTVGVDAKTGQFLWRYDETSKGPANIPTPISRDGYIYSTARSIGAAALLRIEPSGETAAAKQVYLERGLPSTIGGAVAVGDYLYGTTNDGLVAAEFLTGKLRWKEDSLGAGSVLFADGNLYVHAEDGDIALAEATPEAFRQKGRFTPPGKPEHPRGAREKAWAYPVVANGRLYVRDLGVMWCYDVRASR